MATSISYSRGDLYEKYKKSNPQLARKFIKDKNIDLLGSGVGALLITIGIIAVTLLATRGQPTPLQSGVVVGITGVTGVSSLGLLAVWYTKRRIMLAEQLSVQEINGIAGTILVDPLEGFRKL